MLFLGGSNPYKAESQYLDQIPDELNQNLGPYSQTGQSLLPYLTGGYAGLTMAPGQEQAHLSSGFQQSPGYQWNLDQQMQAQNQALAAGGMSGSPESQQFAEKTAHGLADQDFNDYYNRNAKLMQSGLTGLQGLETQGQAASTQMANNMTDYLYNKGNLAGAQAQHRNNLAWAPIGMGTNYLFSPSGRSTPAPIVNGNYGNVNN